MKLAWQRNRQYHLSLIWDELRQNNELPQVDRWLAQYFRQRKKYGRHDHHFYAEAIFFLLRQAVPITAKLLLGNKQDVFSSLGAIRNYLKHYPQPTDVWQTLRQLTYPEISKLLEKLPVYLPSSNSLGQIHPAYQNYLEKRQKNSHWSIQERQTFLRQLSYRPPLWIRLNYSQNKEEVLRELKKNDFSIQEENLGPIVALALRGERGIFELTSYKKGLFEIQDLASQAIGHMVEVQPGMFVWDACAGGGGKTLLLASLTQGRGVVYASDIREYKLLEAKRRVRRAGFSHVRFLHWAGRILPEFPKEVKKRQGFHRVLVDAPCSSSGTWRRNPDVMLRFSLEASLPQLLAEQAALLDAAAEAVRPGGMLVYATCSWLVEENEAQVQEFLKRHPNFVLGLQSLLGSPYKDSDTMFAAQLLKKNN